MGIGNKLQKLIDEKKTNVNELAGRANVSPSTLYSIIKRDNTKVDIDVLIAICKVLGVPVEYFSDTSDDSYYLDPETARLAQELKDNPNYRVLMDASRKLSPEAVEEVMKFIEFQRMKEEPWRADD